MNRIFDILDTDASESCPTELLTRIKSMRERALETTSDTYIETSLLRNELSLQLTAIESYRAGVKLLGKLKEFQEVNEGDNSQAAAYTLEYMLADIGLVSEKGGDLCDQAEMVHTYLAEVLARETHTHFSDISEICNRAVDVQYEASDAISSSHWKVEDTDIIDAIESFSLHSDTLPSNVHSLLDEVKTLGLKTEQRVTALDKVAKGMGKGIYPNEAIESAIWTIERTISDLDSLSRVSLLTNQLKAFGEQEW